MASVDRMSPLLERFRVRTRLFYAGPLCGEATFAAQPGRGFLHVLRRGEMTVSHQEFDGSLRAVEIHEPSLILYPHPLAYAFRNDPSDEAEFACATLDFEGGATHPLVRTLPALVAIPLDAVASLEPALELLFAEIDNVRAGHGEIADRLFEVVLIQLFRWILDNTATLGLPPGLLPGLADDYLAPVLVAIHENPGGSWTLETMAREASMSRSTFAARFRQTVGQPPADYLTDWRLTVAQDRLRKGDAVATVSAELGYANPSAFSRTFTQRLGQSPRAWAATARTQEPVSAA